MHFYHEVKYKFPIFIRGLLTISLLLIDRKLVEGHENPVMLKAKQIEMIAQNAQKL